MARRWFTEVIIILTLGIIAAVMFKNIDLRPVPGPDVFQYIHDSQYYLNFSLPNNIHSPPGNPILIGLISKTIDNPRREVLTAIGINIITSMLIVYLTWRIFQGLYGNFSLLLPLLLLTNALTYSTGLDSTSEVLFTALVLFCIYVYPKHKNVAFLLAGLTFLVRYEAVVLVLALIVTEIYNKTALHAPVKRILLGVIPIVVWVGIINFQNSTGNLVGNEFIQEIIRRSNELPTLKIVTRIPNALLVSISMDSWISLFILLYVIFGMVFLLRRGGRQLALYFIFFLGYILIHLVFPSFSFRYLLPIFPFTYVACLWPLKLKTSNYWQRVIGIIMIVLTIVVAKENVLAINGTLDYYRTQGIENRLTADWLNQQFFPAGATAVTLLPYITQYYVHDSDIHFFYIDKQLRDTCTTMKCVVDSIPEDYPRPYFIIRDVVTDENEDSIIKELGQHLFREFYRSGESVNYQLVTKLERLGKWTMIYKYIGEN